MATGAQPEVDPWGWGQKLPPYRPEEGPDGPITESATRQPPSDRRPSRRQGGPLCGGFQQDRGCPSTTGGCGRQVLGGLDEASGAVSDHRARTSGKRRSAAGGTGRAIPDADRYSGRLIQPTGVSAPRPATRPQIMVGVMQCQRRITSNCHE